VTVEAEQADEMMITRQSLLSSMFLMLFQVGDCSSGTRPTKKLCLLNSVMFVSSCAIR
jgi:hypothetical protein